MSGLTVKRLNEENKQNEEPDWQDVHSAVALSIDPKAPYTVAQLFVTKYCMSAGYRTLHFYRGEFHWWDEICYKPIEDAQAKSLLYKLLSTCESPSEKPVDPDKGMVANVTDALKAYCILASDYEPPCWLSPGNGPPAEEFIACKNGLLHFQSGAFGANTPAFFNHNAVEFDYDPNAPAPARWLQFLDEIWPDDLESQETLQEIFGYCLTGATDHQKIFLMVGPKRAGKGTINRVLQGLVGRKSVVSPTLAQLSQNFGLQSLIGKKVAIVSDARLGGRADQHAIAERLLSISGEDSVNIDRKFKAHWEGRLGVRFVIFSNELPRIHDASGTLATRFIVLRLVKSWFGCEDRQLGDRLLLELPGILNWAIVGSKRLAERGHFIQPRSADEMVDELNSLSAPLRVFVEERCDIGPRYSVAKDPLYQAYRSWCMVNGENYPSSIEVFGKDLRAVVPTLRVSRPRSGLARLRVYEGIRLKAPS